MLTGCCFFFYLKIHSFNFSYELYNQWNLFKNCSKRNERLEGKSVAQALWNRSLTASISPLNGPVNHKFSQLFNFFSRGCSISDHIRFFSLENVGSNVQNKGFYSIYFLFQKNGNFPLIGMLELNHHHISLCCYFY